jgi:hypothetical protein
MALTDEEAAALAINSLNPLSASQTTAKSSIEILLNSPDPFVDIHSLFALYNIRLKLSEPLLEFRPRADVINTLLHEAIHAYFFVTTSWRHSRQ